MIFENHEEMTSEESFKVLEELELNQPKDVVEARRVDEVEIKVTVWVEPGNSSERSGQKLAGTSSRVSRMSVTTVFPQPLKVGDIYRVTFDRDSLDLSPCYALCTTCHFVNEDAFKSTLNFFAPVEIKSH
ncbi:MAG: hypothetical protein ACYST0_02520 [Planctomycetota bacterium]|jgi:hypothetical protein